MTQANFQLYFVLLLLCAAGLLGFYIVWPYLYTLLLAIVCAVIFTPLHEKIGRIVRGRKNIAALLTTIIVCTAVIIPLFILSSQLFLETKAIYLYLTDNDQRTIIQASVEAMQHQLNKLLPVNVNLNITEYLATGVSWLVGNLGLFFSSFLEFIIQFFLFLLALFYFFRDGSAFQALLTRLSPLSDKNDQHIIDKLTLAINSVVRGSLVVASIQGVQAGIGFALFGVPNPILWGLVAAVAALIPSLGTSIVLIPGIIYLFINDHFAPGIGLLIWSATAVGLIDNIVGPLLISKRAQLHSFVILVGVLGGIKFFGLLGFILGPLVMSLLFALIDIYTDLSHNSRRVSI